METQSLIKEMEMLNLMFAELEHVRIHLLMPHHKYLLGQFARDEMSGV